jgi:serine/threonine-protein kinase
MADPTDADSRSGVSKFPKKLFGYDVISLVGEGAGSLIYCVTDPKTNQVYALKHVVRNTDKDIRFIEQLEAEHAVGQKVRHPGLRRTYDLKINRNLLLRPTEAALVMEMFDGEPLETNLPRSNANIVAIFIKVAQALDALHRLGFIHCDLKPNNILINVDRDVKVIDLGQACAIGDRKERIQGTPDYIAPEQVKCLALTTRTDVFNFGATLYWALTGTKLPTLFTLKKGANSFLLDRAITPPIGLNPTVPEALSNIVMECVRTNPSKRPNDLGELAKRLEIIHFGLTRPRDGGPASAS